MFNINHKAKAGYFRNMIFGAEDSLVSTVGVLFGVASTSFNDGFILITGFLVVTVEALSMGAGAFLSEKSAQEFAEENETGESTIIDGLVMFAAYFFAGFIPLLPYIFIPGASAKYFSILFSVIALFFLGFVPQRSFKSGVRMMVVAGLAIFAGFLIGSVSEKFLH